MAQYQCVPHCVYTLALAIRNHRRCFVFYTTHLIIRNVFINKLIFIFFPLTLCVVLRRTLLFAFVGSIFSLFTHILRQQPPSGVTLRVCCGSVWRVVVSNALYFPIPHTNRNDNNMACVVAVRLFPLFWWLFDTMPSQTKTFSIPSSHRVMFCVGCLCVCVSVVQAWLDCGSLSSWIRTYIKCSIHVIMSNKYPMNKVWGIETKCCYFFVYFFTISDIYSLFVLLVVLLL